LIGPLLHVLMLVFAGQQVIGSISGSGRITLVDKQAPPDSPTPVDLDLEKVSLSPSNQIHPSSLWQCILS
jgi:hypothetical protein